MRAQIRLLGFVRLIPGYGNSLKSMCLVFTLITTNVLESEREDARAGRERAV